MMSRSTKPSTPTKPAAPHALLGAGLALAGAVAPLAWTRLLWSEYTLPKIVALSAAALLSAAGLLLSPPGTLAAATELDAPLLGVLAAAALSTLFSSDPRLSLTGHQDGWTFGLWQLGLYAVIFSCAARADAAARRLAVKASLAGAAAVSAYAALQAFGLDPFAPALALPTGGRAVSTLGSPVYLGAYLALWLPVALHWAVDERGEEAFGRVCLALIAGGVVATFSRAAWVASLAGAAAYLALSRKLGLLKHWSARRWAASAAVLLSLVAAGSYAMAKRRHLGEETVRLSIWRTAADAFASHPVLGEGPDNFEAAFRRLRREDYVKARGMEFQAHAHNDLLQALATTGALGAAAYAWLLVSLALAAGRAMDDEAARPLAAALASGLLALWLNMEANIVSMTALAGAALAAGALVRPRAPSPGRPFAAGAALALAAVSLSFSLKLVNADREFRLARDAAAARDMKEAVARFKAAVAGDRCSLDYKEAFINYLGALAPAAPPDSRRNVVDLAASLGRDAVDCHPRTGLAYTIRGYGALLQAAAGSVERLPAARADLERAAQYDPSLLSLLRLRLDAAKLAGDAAAAAALQRRLDALEALAQSRRG